MNENQNEYVDINAHDNYPDSEQKIEIPTMKVIPLKKICMTIGQLPTSYLETMTYYEMLIWFIEYLKNNIIPTINNNSEAVQEVQSVVLALQNYINEYKDSIDADVEELENYMNNYFENLDVQEEINNKLDEMLTDGTLQSIIEQFIQSNALWSFDNVAEMKASTNLINGSYAQTLGYYSISDGGLSLYKIRTKTNNDVINESTLVSVYDSNLVAELIITDEMNSVQFGCKEDATFDNLTFLQIALNNAKTLNIDKDLYISDGLTITNPINIKGSGKIYIPNNEQITPLTITAQNVSIDGIEIDGTQPFIEPEDYTSQAYSTARANNMFGIYILDASDVYVNNVNIHNLTQGVVVRNSTNVTIQNSKIKDTLADGIYISDNSHNIYVTSNLVENTGDDSLACVSTRITYNQSELESIEGFTRSLTYAQCQALIVSTGTIITPVKSYATPCSDVFFTNNIVNISWNSGIKIHGGQNVKATNNIINDCYSWGCNLFYADRCMVSGSLDYYTFSTDSIEVDNNKFNNLLSEHYKSTDLGTANYEGCSNLKITNNIYKMSDDSTYTNPLTRIASSSDIIFSNNKISKSKLFCEYLSNITITNNVIKNSYTFGVSVTNSSDIVITNNKVLDFNVQGNDWQYGIAITSGTAKNNLTLLGNNVETTNNFQGKYQFQNMQNVLVDFMDMSKHASVDISLLGRVNNSSDIKCNLITSTIVPPANITQFIAGTKWINTTNNSVYLYNGTTWSQLTLS